MKKFSIASLILILVSGLRLPISIAETDIDKACVVSELFDKYLSKEFTMIVAQWKSGETKLLKYNTDHILYDEIESNITRRQFSALDNAAISQSWDEDTLTLMKEKLRSKRARENILNSIENAAQIYYDHKKLGLPLAMCDVAERYTDKHNFEYKICVTSASDEKIEYHINYYGPEHTAGWQAWHFRKIGQVYALYDIETNIN